MKILCSTHSPSRLRMTVPRWRGAKSLFMLPARCQQVIDAYSQGYHAAAQRSNNKQLVYAIFFAPM